MAESLAAAEKLAADGVNAKVINIHTIKPLDEELVVAAAKECGRVVTVEEHSVICLLYTSQGDIKYLCIYAELIVELYNYFENANELSPDEIRGCIYSFMHDYEELFAEDDNRALLRCV